MNTSSREAAWGSFKAYSDRKVSDVGRPKFLKAARNGCRRPVLTNPQELRSLKQELETLSIEDRFPNTKYYKILPLTKPRPYRTWKRDFMSFVEEGFLLRIRNLPHQDISWIQRQFEEDYGIQAATSDDSGNTVAEQQDALAQQG